MTLAIFQGIHLSFILDWIFIIGIVILTIPINIISPFERLFNIEDETISYPYKEKETFTIFGLAVHIINYIDIDL